jgi:alanyl-tRNA synthetase
MTEKLFWLDPYQTEFTATIVDQFPVSDGQAVVLNQTCFYATSGGQPYDTGQLNSLAVKDVRLQNDQLIHVVSNALEAAEVQGHVDWQRRFDHMQQHTGQHILSAAFYRLSGAETSSFHLGEDYCSIELNQPGLTGQDVRKAEDLANSIIFGAQPVQTFFVDPDRIGDYPLRKKSDLQESLRIVKISDFDMSPCSGTHVRNTGEIGMVFITGTEKLSQTLKVSFVCGKRVVKQFHHEQELLKQLSKRLTTSPDLLPDSITKLQDQLKQLRKELSQFQEERWKEEALNLYNRAGESGGLKQVLAVWDRPYQEVRYIAQRLMEQPSAIGALVSVRDKRAVFFKNPALPVDVRKLFQQFLQQHSAKGGGPEHLMEAGGFEIQADLEKQLQEIFTGDSNAKNKYV